MLRMVRDPESLSSFRCLLSPSLFISPSSQKMSMDDPQNQRMWWHLSPVSPVWSVTVPPACTSTCLVMVSQSGPGKTNTERDTKEVKTNNTTTETCFCCSVPKMFYMLTACCGMNVLYLEAIRLDTVNVVFKLFFIYQKLGYKILLR